MIIGLSKDIYTTSRKTLIKVGLHDQTKNAKAKIKLPVSAVCKAESVMAIFPRPDFLGAAVAVKF